MPKSFTPHSPRIRCRRKKREFAEAKSGKVDGVTGLLWNDKNQQIQFYTTWDCKDGLNEEESAKITDSKTAGI